LKYNNSRNGFTLVETVILITLVSVLTVFLGGFVLTFSRAWLSIQGRDTAVGSARFGMNRIIAEIRTANTTDGLSTITTSECSFTDIDGQSIDYKQNGTSLMRNTDILLSNLSTPEGLRFTYLDALSSPTATKKNIRAIRVWLYVTAGDQRVTLESSARLRNILQ